MKKWYHSETIWSDIVTILGAVVSILQQTSVIATPVSTQIITIITILAGICGIHGRVRATTTIGGNNNE